MMKDSNKENVCLLKHGHTSTGCCVVPIPTKDSRYAAVLEDISQSQSKNKDFVCNSIDWRVSILNDALFWDSPAQSICICSSSISKTCTYAGELVCKGGSVEWKDQHIIVQIMHFNDASCLGHGPHCVMVGIAFGCHAAVVCVPDCFCCCCQIKSIAMSLPQIHWLTSVHGMFIDLNHQSMHCMRLWTTGCHGWWCCCHYH